LGPLLAVETVAVPFWGVPALAKTGPHWDSLVNISLISNVVAA